MTWRTEWTAISNRIRALLDAGTFFLQARAISTDDPYSVSRTQLLPQARDVYQALNLFEQAYCSVLAPEARDSLQRFLEDRRSIFTDNSLPANPGVNACLTALGAFRSEFEYHLSDVAATARSFTERAFIHLQRSIVADSDVRTRWQQAFDGGEVSCEKLGAVHLLLHGIWGFKVSAEGERTDLVLGEPILDIGEVERAAHALVLTEWKLVRDPSELAAKCEQARAQAARYSVGVLGGIEMASYRYLVLVSRPVLQMPQDRIDDRISYRHVNVAVDPGVPSRRRTLARGEEAP